MAHPAWVLKHKTKGTEVRKINGNYYLYKVTSKWDPEKKKVRKITQALIGAITENGIKLTAERKKAREQRHATAAVEYGATQLLRQIGKPIEQALDKFFGPHAVSLTPQNKAGIRLPAPE